MDLSDEKRYVYYPIKYPDLHEFYKLVSEKNDWVVGEIPLHDDQEDYEMLDHYFGEGAQHFLKHIIAFFAVSDGIVNENLAINMLQKVQIAEAEMFYGAQIRQEGIHAEMYSLFIDTYVKDPEEKERLFNVLENFPAVKKKADWAFKYIDEEDFVKNLIAFAVVEGVFFSGSFCAIYWIRHHGYMPGLTLANEFISRDEQVHCDFAVHFYNNYIPKEDKLSNTQIQEIVKEAVEIEKEFITEALPVKLIGMNQEKMKQYIEFIANNLLISLKVNPVYDTKEQPFKELESIIATKHANFFEQEVSAYEKGEGHFSLDEDF